MTDDVRKLLGGYASGTLTDAEKQTLFEAALSDNDLFDALADEHALKELLDDPAARAHVLRAAETPVFSAIAVLREWFERPRSKALAAAGAVLVVAIAVTTIRDQQQIRLAAVQRPSEPVLLAPMTPAPQQSPVQQEQRPLRLRSSAPAAAGKREGQVAADAPASTKADVRPEDETLQRSQSVAVSGTPAAPAVVSSAFRDEQPAAGTSTPVKYTLMKRSASGEFEGVPLTAHFGADEEARLAVEVTEPGTVAVVRSDSKSVTSTPVQPGRPAIFTLPASTRSATVSFTPDSAKLVGNTLVPAFRSPARLKEAPASAESDMAKQAEPTAPVQIVIKLNRK
jgi:hypothetical protein